jgi:hypothetical protein
VKGLENEAISFGACAGGAKHDLRVFGLLLLTFAAEAALFYRALQSAATGAARLRPRP